MPGERVGDAGRLVDGRELAVALRLGHLDPALDFPHRLEIARELRAVGRGQLAVQVRDLLGDRIEQARVARDARQARLAVGAVGHPEQSLEHRARIDLHRQRHRRGAIGDRRAIGAGVADRARDATGPHGDPQLERGQLRLAPRLERHALVHGHVRDRVDQVGIGMHAREIGRPGARMVAGRIPLARIGGHVRQVAQHDEVVAMGRQAPQDHREVARQRTLLPGEPVAHGHPVGHVEPRRPAHRRRRGAAERGQGGDHRIQEREGQGGPHAPQHGPPREVRLGDEHCELSLIEDCLGLSDSPPWPPPRARRRACGSCGTAGSRRCRG